MSPLATEGNEVSIESVEVPGPLRVAPLVDNVNRAYWTGGFHGQLMITRCRPCGYWNQPATSVCRQCLSRDVSPEPVSGRATVNSYTINYQRWSPTATESPYVVALVELVEQAGLRQFTNIVNCDPADVAIGMSVKVTFRAFADVALPLFEPDEQPT